MCACRTAPSLVGRHRLAAASAINDATRDDAFTVKGGGEANAQTLLEVAGNNSLVDAHSASSFAGEQHQNLSVSRSSGGVYAKHHRWSGE